MMKKILLFALLTVSVMANAQKPFKMECKIEGGDTISKYYIQVGDEGNFGVYLPEEVVDVKKGKFTYSKQINSIVPAWLKKESGDGVPYMTIYLVPGETLKLSIKGDEYFYDGTPIYKSMNEADLALTPYSKAVRDYYMAAIFRLQTLPEDQQSEAVKGVQDTITIKSQEFTDAVKNYTEAHINDEGALLFLTDMTEIEDLNTLVNEKSPAVANGRVGKYIKFLADYEKKVREEQEKEAAAEQAKLDAMNGNAAPDFTLNDINGKPLALSSLRGKYVILDFWGSWCGWCIKGIPEMKKYYEKYAGKFEILGIDCNDTDEAWKKAVEKYELPWLHVYNPRESSVLADYNVSGFPTKIVIDPKGNIAKVIVGEDPAFYTYLDSIFGNSEQ